MIFSKNKRYRFLVWNSYESVWLVAKFVWRLFCAKHRKTGGGAVETIPNLTSPALFKTSRVNNKYHEVIHDEYFGGTLKSVNPDLSDQISKRYQKFDPSTTPSHRFFEKLLFSAIGFPRKNWNSVKIVFGSGYCRLVVVSVTAILTDQV